MSETIGNIIAKDVSARDQSENGARRGNMFKRKSGKNILKNEYGMTLIEILVVIGIIGILAGIGTVMLMRELPTIRLKEATRNLFYDIQSARMTAVRRGLTCELRPQANGYVLVLMQNGADIMPPLKTVNLSDFGGVSFGSLDASAPNPDSGTFTNDRLTIQPSGMANSGAFYLRSSGATQMGRMIQVNVLGRPSIRTWSGATYN